MAGGVALNCVMNAVIRDQWPFKNVWVQPAAGDAGTALGAAQWLDVQLNAGIRHPLYLPDGPRLLGARVYRRGN
jgi:predicted NodU family carbamoyl transferase